jgi:hypothetical protein
MKALSPLATSGATRPATVSHPKRMDLKGITWVFKRNAYFFVYPPQPGINRRQTTYKETVEFEVKTRRFFFASDRFIALRGCLTVTLQTPK